MKKVSLLVLAMAYTGLTYAQPAPEQDNPLPEQSGNNMASSGQPVLHGLTQEEESFLREQSSLQRQVQLMATRVKLMEEKAKYEELSRKIAEASAPPPASFISPPAPVASNHGADPENPTSSGNDSDLLREMSLVSVYGERQSLIGEVFYRGGRMTLRKGDRLPGGWLVSAIEPSRMMVSKGGQRLEIGLGNVPMTPRPAK